MKESADDISDGATRQVVFCPYCGRGHYRDYTTIDEYISCRCGKHFYAFADSGLNITMPINEAECEPVARAMRRFVVSTGRCTGISPRLYQDNEGQMCMDLPEMGPDIGAALDWILEEYQQTLFGNTFISRELIYSICDSFKEGIDVELKKQKHGVDIIKLLRKKVVVDNRRHAAAGRKNIKTAEKEKQESLLNGVIMGLKTQEK